MDRTWLEYGEGTVREWLLYRKRYRWELMGVRVEDGNNMVAEGMLLRLSAPASPGGVHGMSVV